MPDKAITDCPKFNDNQLKELFGLVKRSMQEDAEIAVFICGTPKSPQLGNVCTGSRCEVDISTPKKCPINNKPFGLFHTHPHTKPWTNETDAKVSSQYGMYVSCVGGNDKAPFIILGDEDPAPIKNLTIRCHNTKPSILPKITKKIAKAEQAQAEASKNANTIQYKLQSEGADTKTWMTARLKQYEPADIIRRELTKFTFKQWNLNQEGCVFKK